MIEVHAEPRVSKPWDAFVRENPPFSIALDGYVTDMPRFDVNGPYANFDHHAGVDRLATRSTCMQVHVALTLGLFDAFQKDGEPHAHVWVNDPDQDTCLAVWQLQNFELLQELSTELPLARLLITEDLLDCAGGAYPLVPTGPSMRQQAWVFQPYFDARARGDLQRMDADGMVGVIERVCSRITSHTLGRGEEIALDTRYEKIGGGDGWMMIVEHGPHARSALCAAGVRAFVAVHAHDDGSSTYSLGRMSPFVRFPLDELYERLNEAEGIAPGEAGWGGSNTIGGSPREGGSRLAPEEVSRIIYEHLGAIA
jgi:hypothetical protein